MANYHSQVSEFAVGDEVAYVELHNFGQGGRVRRGLKVVKVTKTRVVVEYQANVGGGKMEAKTDRWVVSKYGDVALREGQNRYYEPRLVPIDSELIARVEAGNRAANVNAALRGAANRVASTSHFSDVVVAELEAALVAFKALKGGE